MDKRLIEIEQCFLLNDFPKQGKIPNSKLISMMRSLGINILDTEVQSLIAKIDPLQKGFFEYEQFKELALTKMNQPVTYNNIDQIFDIFDRDSDGLISLEDLKKTSALLKIKINEDDLNMMFNKVGGNNNGAINKEVFMSLIN